MSKIANMLNMLQILKDQKIHSISSLSEELEVSGRMIRQYKIELEEAGIYLKSYTGKYGGYQLYENSNFLTIKNEIKEKMYIVMKQAIANKNKVKITFKSVNSGLTTRIIHPAELFEYKEKWYIAAFCELRNEIRLFKLDDIIEYKVLDERYQENLYIKK
ncbi:MAG: WYL domain-containing protein [Clostridia bacterium]|nr:WYL domain-containing protein [Clostridia bacterium]